MWRFDEMVIKDKKSIFMKNVFLFFGLLILFGCSTPQGALNYESRVSVDGKITHTGIIDCFEEGLSYDAGVPVYCETSAVLKRGDELLIGIDKPVPGEALSPVFTMPISVLEEKEVTKEQLKYISAAPFKDVAKIEAFANAGDSLFFCSTAFDRIRDTPEWDNYNALLTWQSTDYSDIGYVLPEQNGDVISSKLVRFSLQKALANEQFPDGPPYFKVEALTVLPGDRLIFGVREMGESYQNFEYTFILVETTLNKGTFGIMPSPDFKKIYEFKPEANSHLLGLSDLTYQASTNSLIALTSYEGTGDEATKPMYAYLWVLPLNRLSQNTPPIPVLADGKPLEIPYKGEGIVMLDDRTVFVLHDEDRRATQVDLDGQLVMKKPNQAIFSIIKLR